MLEQHVCFDSRKSIPLAHLDCSGQLLKQSACRIYPGSLLRNSRNEIEDIPEVDTAIGRPNLYVKRRTSLDACH